MKQSTIALFIGVLVLSGACSQNEQSKRIFGYLEKSNTAISESVEQITISKQSQSLEFLEDPSKAIYKKPLSACFQCFNTQYKTINVFLDSLKNVWKKHEKSNTTVLDSKTALAIAPRFIDYKNKILDCYGKMLDTFGNRPFGLQNDEIIARKKYFDQTIGFSVTDSLFSHLFNKTTASVALALLEKWKNDIDINHLQLSSEIGGYIGGRPGCNFGSDWIFPVVLTHSPVIQEGATFEAKIYMGRYSSHVSPLFITLIKNGKDTLTTRDRWYSNYIFTETPLDTGKQRVVIECQINNPRKKIHQVTRDTFYYEVKN